MKQKVTSRGYTEKDLKDIAFIQQDKSLTYNAACKCFDKIQAKKREGAGTVDHIGGPITGKRQAAKDRKAKQREEFLSAANESARIVAANLREMLPHYVRFETLVRQSEPHFTRLQDFFLKHKRDGSELLLGQYNSLKHFLKDACDGMSTRQYHRVINTIKHPLLEEDNSKKTGGKKTPPEKLEAQPSAASEADIIDGEFDEDNSGEEVPAIPQGPRPSLPAPQQDEETPPKREADHLECKREETRLRHSLKVANLAAQNASKDACNISEYADKLHDLLDKIAEQAKQHGNLIPEPLRDMLLDYLPRQLQAFDETFGIVDSKSKKAAA